MKRLFLICSIVFLLLSFTACGPLTGPADENLTIITYAYSYRTDSVDISFLAEKSDGNYAFTWMNHGLPTYEDILVKTTNLPNAELEINIIDENAQNVSGTTDQDGHLSLSVPFQQGIIVPNGLSCEEITSWSFPKESSLAPGGGAVLMCNKPERKTFSS